MIRVLGGMVRRRGWVDLENPQNATGALRAGDGGRGIARWCPRRARPQPPRQRTSARRGSRGRSRVQVETDYSWLAIFLLVLWSLSAGFFPETYAGEATFKYWILGFVGDDDTSQ